MTVRLLKTVLLGLLPVMGGLLVTAALAANAEEIVGFMFGGPAAGWQRIVVIVVFLLPVGVTLAIVEYVISRRRTPDAGPR